MQNVASVIENEGTRVEQRLEAAWSKYQPTEKYGMAFGKICFEIHAAIEGTQGKKGQGWRPLLERQKIPFSTANFWERRYKESEGIVDVEPLPSPEEAAHEAIAAAICQTLEAKSVACLGVKWAPWTPTTDADIRDLGAEPNNDRYRVTLYLSQEQAENLICPS
jgi:hypothetical protein